MLALGFILLVHTLTGHRLIDLDIDKDIIADDPRKVYVTSFIILWTIFRYDASIDAAVGTAGSLLMAFFSWRLVFRFFLLTTVSPD